MFLVVMLGGVPRHYFTDLVIRNIHHLNQNEPLENEVDFQTGYRKVIDYK